MTVSIMLVGAILLTANGASLPGRNFAIMYIVSQFVFGYGVGGEYPMAAGSAAERAEAGGRKKAAKRGQEVVLTFSMQGRHLVTHASIGQCQSFEAVCDCATSGVEHIFQWVVPVK